MRSRWISFSSTLERPPVSRNPALFFCLVPDSSAFWAMHRVSDGAFFPAERSACGVNPLTILYGTRFGPAIESSLRSGPGFVALVPAVCHGQEYGGPDAEGHPRDSIPHRRCCDQILTVLFAATPQERGRGEDAFPKGFGPPPGPGPGGPMGPGGPGFGPGNFLGPQALAAADADEDGRLTPAEAAEAARKFVRDADADKKGSVDAQALGRAINRRIGPPPGSVPMAPRTVLPMVPPMARPGGHQADPVALPRIRPRHVPRPADRRAGRREQGRPALARGGGQGRRAIRPRGGPREERLDRRRGPGRGHEPPDGAAPRLRPRRADGRRGTQAGQGVRQGRRRPAEPRRSARPPASRSRRSAAKGGRGRPRLRPARRLRPPGFGGDEPAKPGPPRPAGRRRRPSRASRSTTRPSSAPSSSSSRTRTGRPSWPTSTAPTSRSRPR